MHRQRLLLAAQYVDRKVLRVQVSAERIRHFGYIPQDQRRLQRYRAEAVRSNSAGLAIRVAATHDRNAGRELAKALPEFFHLIHQWALVRLDTTFI